MDTPQTDDHPRPSPPQEREVVLVGKGESYEGKLTFEGVGRIEGQVRGDVFSKGTLIVGEQAEVEGSIDVDVLTVRGTVRGHITASRAVHLRAPARVRAALASPSLEIERGVLFDGTSQMAGDEATQEPPPPPEPPAHRPGADVE